MKGIYLVMSSEVSGQKNALGSIKDLGGKGLHAGLSTASEFQKFLLRGNVIDLAVGVVIGAAFNGLVQAIVKDLITPLIGLFGVPDFSNLKYGPYNGNVFLFGDVINLLIGFLITAAVVFFLIVKPVNALHDRFESLRSHAEEKETTRECPYCLSTVPLAATRCAYCTSDLPAEEAAVGEL
jgi:large conductance mechanosensitive channel